MTCIIGSGGKTSFLRYLSERLPGTVILTTTTHMFPFQGIPLLNTARDRKGLPGKIRDSLGQNKAVCLGNLLPEGKLSSPSDAIPLEELLSLADYVLVEADGSRQLPLKAHRETEPVIPPCASLTIGIAGASGIGRPLREVCHCPGIFAALAMMKEDQTVQPEHIARVLNREDLADLYLVNQTDALADPRQALKLCALIRKKAFAGSLRTGSFL